MFQTFKELYKRAETAYEELAGQTDHKKGFSLEAIWSLKEGNKEQ